jgi:putative ABC transport system permease protein
MRFSLVMAWRQTRGAWRQFAAFFACVALGVGALVSVGTFAANLERTLAREAKALMGGDVELRSVRALPANTEAAVARLRRAGATVVRLEELVGMARDPARGASLLIELKAVEPGYPLYGRLQTSPAAPLAALLARDGALVQRDLLDRLGLRVGDGLAIGAGQFTVSGVVESEPDRSASLVALGPRVLIAAAALPRTGLVQRGSRVRHRVLLRLPDTIAPKVARAELAREVDDPSVRVSLFDEAQPGLRRFFSQLTTYLGLVGLASLLVGAIGVGSSVSTFVRRQTATIAILKAVGADARTLLVTFLVQTLALGALGSVLGAVLGVTLQPVLIRLLGGFVPFALEARIEPWTAARGVTMGLLVTLLAALWPLLEVRAVRPSLLLRREVEGGAARGRRPWVAALPIAGGLVALSLWQAGSLKVGLIFLGGSVAALAALLVVARALIALARRVPRLPTLAWRQGVSALRRPGGQSVRVVVALGVGVMLLVAVALLQDNLGRQIDREQQREAPSFFFIDLQPDQRDAFVRLVGDAGSAPPALTPVIRSRLAAIDGRPVTREDVDARRARADDSVWFLTREYVLTYASAPPGGNVVTRGRWWTSSEADGRPRISVEETAARALGVDVGSTLTFDIQGVTVEAEVMSLRKVDWQTLSTNFFVIFSPGALDGAPATYVATARVPLGAERRLQDAVVAAFPNVTALPVRDILERVSTVLGEIAVAIRLVALFTVGTGLVVMAGALTASRYQRLYESVVLRTLGATRGVVARTFAVEYALLGAAAGVGGTLLAVALAWGVTRFVLDTPWTLEPGAVLLGVTLTVMLAVAIGFLATFRLLGSKPLPVLRGE